MILAVVWSEIAVVAGGVLAAAPEMNGHNSLVITSEEEAKKSISTRIYQVDDLTRQPTPSGNRPFDDDPFGPGYPDAGGSTTAGSSSPVDLLDAIVNTIEPQTWGEEGPGRGCVLVIGGRSVLVIRQDFHTHRMIDRLLGALRGVGKDAPKSDVARDTGPSHRSAPAASKAKPMTNDPFGAPAPAGSKSSEPRPTDDPFGAPAPKRKPPEDDPFAIWPPATSPNNPFAGGASVPADNPFGSAPANPLGSGPGKDPFAIPEKK